MKLYLIYLVCITLAYGSTPDYFPQCKRNDPEIEKCILEGVEAIKPKLKDGIPEINLPPLDPLKMERIDVNSSVAGATIKAVIENVVARGGSDFNIRYLKINLTNTYAGELKLQFPRLEVESDYSTQGSRMLLFNLNGNGSFSGTFNNVEVDAEGVASPITKDGVEYLVLESLKTRVTIGEGHLKVKPVENTFTGRAASSFVTWNPSVVLKVLSPVIDNTTAPIVTQYLNEVLATVPLKDFLTDE